MQDLLGFLLDLLSAAFDVLAGAFHRVAAGRDGGYCQHQRKPESMNHFFLLSAFMG